MPPDLVADLQAEAFRQGMFHMLIWLIAFQEAYRPR
jgi:hypothetical protein